MKMPEGARFVCKLGHVSHEVSERNFIKCRSHACSERAHRDPPKEQK